MSIVYTSVFNINISDPVKAAQVHSVLVDIGSTAEGQVLFSRIQQATGTVNITAIDGNSSTYSGGTINLDWQQLSTIRFNTPEGYQTPSINSVIVHEMFHAANMPYLDLDNWDESMRQAEEASATQFTNLFMDEHYYGLDSGLEPERLEYDDSLSNQPAEDVPFYYGLSTNPDDDSSWFGGNDTIWRRSADDCCQPRCFFHCIQDHFFNLLG